jgi:hypothetical protein
MSYVSKGAQIPGARSPWRLNCFHGRIAHLWVLSKELAPCHPSGAQNFEVAPRFFKNL